MAADPIALPEGFTLDPSPSAAPAGLPAGFKLDAPSAPAVASGGYSGPLPANAGLSDLGASLLGIPVDAVQNVLNLGRALVGTGATAILGKPELAPDLQTGAVGGSQWLKDKLRQTGMPGLSPDNPTPNDPLGTAQYEFVRRGGPLPQGAAPAIGSMVAEAVGGPEWAGVGGMLPTAFKQGMNELQAPGRQARQAQNQVRDSTLQRAQDEGLKVIPSSVNQSFAGNRMESLGGKAAIKQDLTLQNQTVFDKIARRESGLPENAPLTQRALEARRQQLSGPYNAVANLSSNAAFALRELRDARQKATQFWQEYERQKTVASLENYKAMNAKAGAMEKRIDLEAVKAGRPELIPALKEARQAIAKTWDVERALNLGDGTIDAASLGRALDHGAKLSGGLETIAKFQQGPGRQVSGQAATTPTPDVSKLQWVTSGIGGGGGFALGGPVGAMIGAAVPVVAPTAARSVVTSDAYQSKFARPNYGPSYVPENSLQSLLRTIMLEQQAQQK